MKKTTLTTIFLFIICTVAGQVTIVDTTTGTLPAGNTNYSEPSSESDRFGNTEYILCANMFTLTQTTQLLNAEFRGENSGNSFTPANFSVFIVNNTSSNLPKFNNNVTNTTLIQNLHDAPVSLFRIPLNQGFTISQYNTTTKRTDIVVNFTVANGNNPVILPAGTYWMIAAQYVPDGSPGEPTFYWGWLGSSATSTITPKRLNNTFFSSGWNNVPVSGGTATSLAWKLTGNVTLSADEFSLENVSIYPNPTTNIVNINLPENVILDNIKLYNSMGQQLNMALNPKENKIDVSSLSSGIYTVSGNTNMGTFNRRIIKR